MDLLRDLPLPHIYEKMLGKDEDQWPPEARFVVAAYYGNVRRLKEIARSLDRKGKKGVEATLTATTYRGMNALHAAVGGLGKLAACRYLVDTVGMDVNMWDTSPSKKTPLEHAVTGGNLPAIRFLLDHGADLHQETEEAATVLHQAAVRGKKTPLEHAVTGGNLPAIRFLLDHGADLHQETEEAATVLHQAAVRGKCQIVRMLLSRGADVDGNSEQGTPLNLACLKGHESTVEVLVEYNADVNKVVPSCLATPLDAAVFATSTTCVKLLILAGANVNDRNNNPLARAASEGLTEIVKFLLEAGADPNRPDECGRMPIELAAVYGTREDVELLFPFTSPIPNVADWSIDGIINHAKLESMQLMDDDAVNKRKSDLKQQGDEAFEKQDYTSASVFYTKALRADPLDRKMLANRSCCWLRLGDAEKAVKDAIKCKNSHEEWADAHHCHGEALMMLKEYVKACEVLTRGLELDPENDEMDKLFWEAMELKK